MRISDWSSDVCSSDLTPFTFPSVEKQFTIESLIEQCITTDSVDPEVHAAPDRIIYILHTSGSTGVPKGVCMGQQALVNLLKWQMEAYTASAGCHTLQFSPLTFAVSFKEIFSTPLPGGLLSIIADRPEESRVGKACVRRCRYRWS